MDALHRRYLNGWEKSLTATTQECSEQYWTSPGGNTPQSSSYPATYLPSRKLSKLDNQSCWTMLEKQGQAHKWFPLWTPHMAKQKQGDQLEPTYSSSVPIRDVTLWTCQKRWWSGERGLGISMLVARQDDDDDAKVNFNAKSEIIHNRNIAN